MSTKATAVFLIKISQDVIFKILLLDLFTFSWYL